MNVFKDTAIYGKLGVFDYSFKEISTNINDLYFSTISAPVYSTISHNVYLSLSNNIYSISAPINKTISEKIYLSDSTYTNYYVDSLGVNQQSLETLSGGYYINYYTITEYENFNIDTSLDDTIFNFDAAGNKVYYNYINQEMIDNITWKYYASTVYEQIVKDYIYRDIFYTQVYESSGVYIQGNTKIDGNLTINQIKTNINGLSISGNIIVQPTYKIQCDSIVAGESKNLYIGCDVNTENIYIGSNCNIYLDSSLNYITKNNIDVVDPLIRLNKGGVTNIGCGIEVETNNLISDYIKTNGIKWVIKSNSGTEYDIVTSNDLNNYPTNSSITTINNKITDGINSIYTKYIQCAGMVTGLHNTSLVQGSYVSWNTTNNINEMAFINSRGGKYGGFRFYDCASNTVNSATEVLTIHGRGTYNGVTGYGFVGIDAPGPSEKLEIKNGNLYMNTTSVNLYLSTSKNNLLYSDNTNLNIASNGNINFTNANNSLSKMIIDVNGNVGIGVIPSQKLHINGNAFIAGTTLFLGNTNNALYGDTSMTYGTNGGHYFNTSGTNKVSITNTGNLGIGTTSPTEKIHVIGNILATGSITGSNISTLETKTIKIDNTSYSTTFSHNIEVTGSITALNYFQTYFWRGILDSTNNVYPTISLVLSCVRQSVGYYKFTVNTNEGNEFYHVSVDVIKNNTPTLANQLIYFVTNKSQYYFYITLMTPAGVLCDVERANGGYISVVVTPIK